MDAEPSHGANAGDVAVTRCAARMTRVLALALVLTLALGPSASTSEVELGDAMGHPRDRFPLAVHLVSTGEAVLDAAVRQAVDDWNALARRVLAVDVFAWTDREEDAHVRVVLEPAGARTVMGVAHIDADAMGIIQPPVRVVLAEPAARGQTSRETVLYQVAAHELGHALGLPHVSDPRSIMCCVRGGVDLADPAVRHTYVEARRHPDLRTVEGQLGEHYARFWQVR